MVTAPAAVKPSLSNLDMALPWDSFLEAQAKRDGLREAEAVERWIKSARLHIERFRSMEWPNIKTELRNKYGWSVPDGLEPHWVGPGIAVMWQRQIVRVRERQADGSVVPLDKDFGWAATGGIPVNNANVLSRWLDNGMRFRPPLEGTPETALKDITAEARLKALEEPPAPTRIYWCKRHDLGPMQFPNWKAYVRHCVAKKELPEETPPVDILERRKKFRYYCVPHEMGFNLRRLAERHMSLELRKPGRATHPSLEQMDQKQKGVK